MRLVAALGCAIALLGILAGCGGSPDGIGFGGAPGPTIPPKPRPAPVPDGPVAPPGGQPLPPTQVDATRLPEGYPRLVWTEQDGRAVGAYGRGGGCTEVRAELVEQTDELVRLRLVEVTTSGGPCTRELRFAPLTARLDAPLDGRTVVLERTTIGPPGERSGPR